MRLYFIPVLLCSVLLIPFNQNNAQSELEVGLFGGVSLYSGDLSPEEFGLFFDDLNPAGGLYIRFRPVNRIAFRVSALFTQVSAVDDESPLRNPDGLNRALNFRSDLTDIGVTVELDLFYLGNKYGNYLAPYVFGGGSLVSFNPEGNLDGVWYELQPLATEGQGLARGEYAAAPYELNEFVFNIGGGLRWRVSDRVIIGAEIGGRQVASDYLDDISNTPVNYLDILENTGPLAAQLSNPFIENPSTATDLDYRRGGEFADWYFAGGLTIGIILGEGRGGGGRGKTGCYKF